MSLSQKTPIQNFQGEKFEFFESLTFFFFSFLEDSLIKIYEDKIRTKQNKTSACYR